MAHWCLFSCMVKRKLDYWGHNWILVGGVWIGTAFLEVTRQYLTQVLTDKLFKPKVPLSCEYTAENRMQKLTGGITISTAAKISNQPGRLPIPGWLKKLKMHPYHRVQLLNIKRDIYVYTLTWENTIRIDSWLKKGKLQNCMHRKNPFLQK